MKATEHAGDEKRVQTSSDQKAMGTEQGRKKGAESRAEADRKLGQSGVSVSDIAEQSAYEDDQADIAQTAANSDRNLKG